MQGCPWDLYKGTFPSFSLKFYSSPAKLPTSKVQFYQLAFFFLIGSVCVTCLTVLQSPTPPPAPRKYPVEETRRSTHLLHSSLQALDLGLLDSNQMSNLQPTSTSKIALNVYRNSQAHSLFLSSRKYHLSMDGFVSFNWLFCCLQLHFSMVNSRALESDHCLHQPHARPLAYGL